MEAAEATKDDQAVRAYHKALEKQDWLHEFSDDYRAYVAGRESLKELRKLQREVDPSGFVWMAYLNKQWPAGIPGDVARPEWCA
jgi:hypothetical protein